VLPLIKIEGFKNIVPEQYILNLPILNLNSDMIILNEVVIGPDVSKPFWSVENLFLLGVITAGIVFLVKLVKLINLIRVSPKQKFQNLLLVVLSNSKSAFSFFNYLFIGENIESKERLAIIEHEVIHIKQRHTLDLLLFEFLRIVFWFNPFVYMYQNRISDLHEFIADSKAVKRNKKQYYENLLFQVFDTNVVSFINPFFKQSLIKKRIIMLQKTKSKQIQLIKYLLLIPMIIGMLIYTSCSEEANVPKIENNTKIESGELLKIIDAVKEQIEIQGNISKAEENGIALLSKMFASHSRDINHELISDVQNYNDEKNKSELHKRISNLFQAIQEQGNISTEEELSLKALLILISKDGFNSSFYEEVKDRIEVPFNVIETAPAFPNSKSYSSEAEKKRDFNTSISSFVMKNFNTNLANDLGLNGVQKIYTFFKIDVNGQIIDIKVRAQHPDLVSEVIRVVKMLPTMIPGEQRGKKVTVPYYLPIKFKVNE
jgi:hypothetical protein